MEPGAHHDEAVAEELVEDLARGLVRVAVEADAKARVAELADVEQREVIGGYRARP